MEEFIPTFEEKQDNNLLVQIDEFEEQIKLIEKLSNKYESLKKKIKTQMLNIGKEKDLSQVKWITPKGIQITCSIGKKPTFEEQEYQEFDMESFRKENPSMYEKYLVTRKKQVAITNGSNDRLTITLPKEEKDE